jgi:hypothetical protein
VTLRAILGESQFRELLARRPITVQIPGGENLELVLADINRVRLFEIHLEVVERPPDPPQAREFLPARKKRR